ncbi:MAG: glycosyltransferase [Candidatus Omnitrophica bacterium]|nr:glycosyltransferase [Candidatus Omnitrophota bacterium]
MIPGKLLIVGQFGYTNVGGSFEKAARRMGWVVQAVESRNAAQAPWWVRQFNWRFRDKRPARLKPFGQDVIRLCRDFRPGGLLATGFAPLDSACLREIGTLGVRRMNYLTDDPWNPAHRAGWFLEALPFYDEVFSPRRANLQDLKGIGCRRVSYLPFGYDPDLFFPDTGLEVDERLEADIVFVGSGDRDRIPFIRELFKSGCRAALYGPFWDRYPEMRNRSKGAIGPDLFRKVMRHAKAALCLVRRANRDGHAMRTFEIPAVGACMLTEDTQEHREIFGPEGKFVLYFQSPDEMVRKLRFLLANEPERKRLAQAAHHLIAGGKNRYQDRLEIMLEGNGR